MTKEQYLPDSIQYLQVPNTFESNASGTRCICLTNGIRKFRSIDKRLKRTTVSEGRLCLEFPNVQDQFSNWP